MRLRTIFGRLCTPWRMKSGWGLAAVLAAPTLAFGQFAEVHQLNYWDYDSEIDDVVPLQLDSRVIRVELGFDMFDPSSAQLLDENGGAFVNLMFRPDPAMPWEWAVQNVYESVPNETWFELGNIAYEFGSDFWMNGVPLGECDLSITLTEEPLLEEPFVEPGFEQHVFVDPENQVFSQGMRIEGMGGDLGVVGIPDWEAFVKKFGLGRPVETARSVVAPKDFTPVQEGINDCAPASHARSVATLLEHYGITLEEGDEELTPQQLHTKYVVAMNTTRAGGTDFGNAAVDGRREVNNDLSLPIRGGEANNYRLNHDTGKMEHSGFTDDEFAALYRAARDRLRHGHDVEIAIWREKPGAGTGTENWRSHALTLVGIEKYVMPYDCACEHPLYRFKILDDPQGDGMVENRVRDILVMPDGRMMRQRQDADGKLLVDENGYPILESWGRVLQFSWDEYTPRLVDMNDDGRINGADLAQFLGAWSDGIENPPDGSEDDGDFNGDHVVDGTDLGYLFGRWCIEWMPW